MIPLLRQYRGGGSTEIVATDFTEDLIIPAYTDTALIVKAIQAGIDLSGAGIAKADCGVFTLLGKEKVTDYKIQHGLGETPKFAYVYTDMDPNEIKSDPYYYVLAETFYGFNASASPNKKQSVEFYGHYDIYSSGSGSNYYGRCLSYVSASLSSEHIRLSTPYRAAGYTNDFSKETWYLKGGIPYYWFALA